MKNKQVKLVTVNKVILDVVEKQRPETVKELIKLVQKTSPIPEHDILEHIIRLQSEGRLVLRGKLTQPPSTLTGYLLSSHASWYWLTITLAAVTALAVFTIPEDLYPLVYARYVLGAVFILWLPGYSFIKALFPTKVPIPTSSKELDSVERAALSAAMSIALTPLTGLLLNYTPWGIRLTPITLSLLTLTAAFATAALLREHSAAKAVTKEEEENT